MGRKVLTKSETKKLENFLIETEMTPGLLLMENAGRTVAERVSLDLDTGSTVLILCGRGNNGGDGYVAARHLQILGMNPIIWAIGGTDAQSLDTRTMCRCARACRIEINEIKEEADLADNYLQISAADAIVDAISGIGINRDIEGYVATAIDMVNSSSVPKFAIDMPTGIDADTGKIMGKATKANTTITFYAYKPGQLVFPGRKYCGEVVVASLCKVDILPKSHQAQSLLEHSDIGRYLAPRKIDSHKGDFGKAVLIGGSVGMSGAVSVSAFAALRSGTGRLTVATPKSVAGSLWNRVPEAMTYPVSEEDGKLCGKSLEEIEKLLESQTCAAIGPGLGKGEAIKEIVLHMCEQKIPLVIDADGLNAIAGSVEVLKDAKAKLILTPHAAEMARLCRTDVETIINSPVEAARDLAKKINAVVLLKGSTSIIASPDGRISYNITGGPQLSKGGSGDVLTGIILAMLSQGLSCYNAARLGSLLLGKAAECVPKDEKSILARDVIEAIPLAFAH